MGISRKLILREYCLDPFFTEPIQQIKSKFSSRLLYGNSIDPTFAKQMNLSKQIQTLSLNPLFLTAREEHRSSLATGLYAYAMETTDKATATKSIEARYPFFDRRLMEFCLAIPLEQKFRQGYPRAILRHAMKDILPSEIQWRVSKAQLGSNFRRNLLDRQRQTMNNAIHDRKITPYINMSQLNAAYNRYAIENRPQPGDELDVFNSTLLSLWLNRLQPSA